MWSFEITPLMVVCHDRYTAEPHDERMATVADTDGRWILVRFHDEDPFTMPSMWIEARELYLPGTHDEH